MTAANVLLSHLHNLVLSENIGLHPKIDAENTIADVIKLRKRKKLLFLFPPAVSSSFSTKLWIKCKHHRHHPISMQ